MTRNRAELQLCCVLHVRRNIFSPVELAIYEWQMWVRDLGVEGQRKLKYASVLISRCGGLGSTRAAAARFMLRCTHGDS